MASSGITFVPIQQGSGTPSPTNVRPIIAPLSITGIGDIYGGYLDIYNCEVVEEWHKRIYTNNDKFGGFSENYNGYWTELHAPDQIYWGGINSTNPSDQILCDVMDVNTVRGNGGNISSDYIIKTWVGRTENSDKSQLCFVSSNFTNNKNDFLEWLDIYTPSVCYFLLTPIHHSLTVAQMQEALAQLKPDLTPVTELRRRIIMNSPHLESDSASLVNFRTDMRANLKECKAYFSPVQSGSGDPSPNNVRPITGWDGVTVTICGKNLFNGVLYNKKYENNQWKNTNSWCSTDFILVKPNTKYTMYCNNPTEKAHTYKLVFNENMELVNPASTTSYSVTTSSDTKYLVVYGSTNMLLPIQDTLMVLEGDEDSPTYEPYKGTLTTIDWSDTIGTIYGGYVDLMNGEIVAEWGIKTIGDLTWYYDGSYTRFDTAISDIKQYSSVRTTPFYASSFVTIDDGREISSVPNNAIYGAANSTNVYIKSTDYSTVRDFKNAYGTQQFAYPLETPIHYPITPSIIRSLNGTNNIWSDTNGDVDVKWWTH